MMLAMMLLTPSAVRAAAVEDPIWQMDKAVIALDGQNSSTVEANSVDSDISAGTDAEEGSDTVTITEDFTDENIMDAKMDADADVNAYADDNADADADDELVDVDVDVEVGVDIDGDADPEVEMEIEDMDTPLGMANTVNIIDVTDLDDVIEFESDEDVPQGFAIFYNLFGEAEEDEQVEEEHDPLNHIVLYSQMPKSVQMKVGTIVLIVLILGGCGLVAWILERKLKKSHITNIYTGR
jgi:hypothetical protein